MAADVAAVVDDDLGFDAVSVVDAALGILAEREIVSRDEAVWMLHDVENAAPAPARPTVTSIVDGFETTYGDDILVGRMRVLDPLLEIRSALTGN